MEKEQTSLKTDTKEVAKKKMSRTKKVLLSLLLIISIAIISFVIYEVATRDNTYYIEEKNLQIPILVYHDLVEDNSQIEEDCMQTTVDTFEKQITGLMNLGYKPISYQDLADYKNGKKAIPKWSFLITFDDGYTGVYKYAFEIAKKYNIPMTSFLIDDTVGIPGYYSWEEAKEMHNSGVMYIYSHGLTHIKYNEENVETLVNNTNKAHENLKKHFEDESLLKVFTYPYGLNTVEERKALENEGFIQNLTDNKVNTSKKLDLSGLHRVYALQDSTFKIILKLQYRLIKYK